MREILKKLKYSFCPQFCPQPAKVLKPKNRGKFSLPTITVGKIKFMGSNRLKKAYSYIHVDDLVKNFHICPM